MTDLESSPSPCVATGDPLPSTPAPTPQHATGARDLTTGPITRTLLVFMIPTLGSSVLQSLNGSINTVWIGRLLGENALAATSNANTVMFMMLAFVFGFGMAATILIGQAFGRRDIEGARRVVGTAFTAFGAVAIVMSAIGYLLSPAILHLLATPPPVMDLALAYLRVIFLGLPAALMLTMLMMALRGGGTA